MIELLKKLWNENKITDEVYGQILDELMTEAESEIEVLKLISKNK